MRLHLVSRPRPEEISTEALEKARDQLIRCGIANSCKHAQVSHSFLLKLVNEVLRWRDEELELAIDTAEILDLDAALEALRDDESSSELEELAESDSYSCLPRLAREEPELRRSGVASKRQPPHWSTRPTIKARLRQGHWLGGDHRILAIAVLLIVIVLCGFFLIGCSP